MSFRERLIRFFSGRYGVDALFYGLFAVAALFAVINLFLRSWILQIVIYFVVIAALFRMLSRDIPARRRENEWFIKISEPLRQKAEQIRRQRADSSHVYRKCRHCKAILRLPRRVGKHKTVCPKCGREMTVRVYR